MSKKKFVVRSGDRVAQMVLCPINKINFKQVKKLPKSIRGKNFKKNWNNWSKKTFKI